MQLTYFVPTIELLVSLRLDYNCHVIYFYNLLTAEDNTMYF